MYGKVFESIYDGTLAGHWQAIVTMQQLIVLANEDGIVDMTPDAISRRTSIPLHIINAGLEHLAKPDPYTRTPGEEGRRIIMLDEHRPWGWRLVNFAKYRGLRNMEQKREADRERIAEKRRKNKDVATPSRGVADVAHTDTEAVVKTLSPPGTSVAFDSFWLAWPKSSRKGSKGECWSLWKSRGYDAAVADIVRHVEAMKSSTDWKKNGGEFIPAPLPYLRQRRWEGAEAGAQPEKRMVM